MMTKYFLNEMIKGQGNHRVAMGENAAKDANYNIMTTNRLEASQRLQ